MQVLKNRKVVAIVDNMFHLFIQCNRNKTAGDFGNTESESYITTDGQSASLPWNKGPVWCLRPDFYYCQTVAGLLMWGALSVERTSMSFIIAPGPRQRSHFRVRVPPDSWPYFTVSDSRLRHLLRLAGLRWRYSTSPPHGILVCLAPIYKLPRTV
jgi:hypothetical protein